MIMGVPIRKENFIESFLLRPKRRAAIMVEALRLVPGMRARHCPTPIRKASFVPSSFSVFLLLDTLSLSHRRVPKKMRGKMTKYGL